MFTFTHQLQVFALFLEERLESRLHQLCPHLGSILDCLLVLVWDILLQAVHTMH